MPDARSKVMGTPTSRRNGAGPTADPRDALQKRREPPPLEPVIRVPAVAAGEMPRKPQAPAIVRGIQGLIRNPIVQGVGLTAAAGFNPLIGLLAAPQIRAKQESGDMGRQMAELELKALRDRLSQTSKARSGLGELVSELASIPGSNMPGGPGASTPGAGPRINRQQEQFLRTLVEGGNTDAASQLIGGLLGIGEQRPARGLEGTFEAIERRIGRPLKEDEVFQIADGGDSTLAAQLGLSQAQVELMRSQLELQALRDGIDEEASERAAEELQQRQDFLAQVTRDLEAAELLDELEDSFLAKPGFGAGTRGQVQSALGLVDDEAGRLSSLQQRFKQLSTLAGIDVVKSLGIEPTDRKFERMMQTSLSTEIDPDVNRLVLLDRFEAALEQGGDELPPAVRSEIKSRIKQFQSQRGKTFANREEIRKALQAGEIKRGDAVILNGRKFRIE